MPNRSKFVFLFLYFSILLAAIFSAPRDAQAFVFEKDLRFGSQANDVLEMQKILNSDPATVIAAAGPGSPGQETAYFGTLTLKAVLKFQYKYREEILKPAGLTQSNGFVGPKTREKLTFLSQKPATAATQSAISTTTAPTTAKAPKLYAFSPFQIAPGGKITLNGADFSQSGNVLHIGTGFSVETAVIDPATLSATLPTSISEGKYPLWVTNTNGSSKNDRFTVTLVVTHSPKPAPEITATSPSKLSSADQSLTISGSGFLANNTIYTAFGSVSAASPDGRTITFSPSALPDAARIKEALETKTSDLALLIEFYVGNDNGLSAMKSFTIQ